MFDVSESAEQSQSARRFAVSGLLAAGTCAAIALAAVTFGGRVQTLVKEAKVDVIFQKPAPPPVEVKVEPPPPPPPRALKKLPKVEAPPVVEPAAMVAPKEVPVEKPPEADEKNAVAEAPIAVGGTGELVPGAIGAIGSGKGGDSGAVLPATGGRPSPINLPEDATPPVENVSNLSPSYPDDARAKGIEGLVILKVVVEADGSIGAIKVMKGEEPFVAAALQAVKGWRYSPALVEGRATAVYRILKIPFRIKS